MTECKFQTAQPAWSSQTPPMCGKYMYQCLTTASGCCKGCLLPPSLADGRQTGGRQTGLGGNRMPGMALQLQGARPRR
jgi:hypothetical protein